MDFLAVGSAANLGARVLTLHFGRTSFVYLLPNATNLLIKDSRKLLEMVGLVGIEPTTSSCHGNLDAVGD
jgi:hypothetical protein